MMCACGCNSCKTLGRISNKRKVLNGTDFFSELFPVDAQGNRAFTLNVQLDMKSVLLLAGGVLVAGSIIKKL